MASKTSAGHVQRGEKSGENSRDPAGGRTQPAQLPNYSAEQCSPAVETVSCHATPGSVPLGGPYVCLPLHPSDPLSASCRLPETLQPPIFSFIPPGPPVPSACLCLTSTTLPAHLACEVRPTPPPPPAKPSRTVSARSYGSGACFVDSDVCPRRIAREKPDQGRRAAAVRRHHETGDVALGGNSQLGDEDLARPALEGEQNPPHDCDCREKKKTQTSANLSDVD